MITADNDELIKVQSQVIGILFEVIKRLQANNDLDEEYFEIVAVRRGAKNTERLNKILEERAENAKVASRLLEQLDA